MELRTTSVHRSIHFDLDTASSSDTCVTGRCKKVLTMRFPWQKQGRDPVPAAEQREGSSEPPTQDQSREDSNQGEKPSIDNKESMIPSSTEEKSSPRPSLQTSDAVTRDRKESGIQTVTPGPDGDTNTRLEPTASRATQASSVGEAGEDDESKYPGLIQLASLTFGLCVAVFLIALDNTIIGSLDHSLNLLCNL